MKLLILAKCQALPFVFCPTESKYLPTYYYGRYSCYVRYTLYVAGFCIHSVSQSVHSAAAAAAAAAAVTLSVMAEATAFMTTYGTYYSLIVVVPVVVFVRYTAFPLPTLEDPTFWTDYAYPNTDRLTEYKEKPHPVDGS